MRSQPTTPNSVLGNLDLAKSKFSPGFPTPNNQTFKFEMADSDGIKFAQDGADDRGSLVHIEYVAKLDGNDYPVEGDPNRDSVSLRRIDAYRMEGTSKKVGKTVGTFHFAVSNHGKVLTIVSKGIRGGRPYDNVAIFNRQ
jgi:hypothetical protein